MRKAFRRIRSADVCLKLLVIRKVGASLASVPAKGAQRSIRQRLFDSFPFLPVEQSFLVLPLRLLVPQPLRLAPQVNYRFNALDEDAMLSNEKPQGAVHLSDFAHM